MLNNKIKILSILSIIFILLTSQLHTPTILANEKNIKELEDISKEIINWKKSELEISSDEHLLSNHFLKNAGLSSGDWFPLGIGRLGYEDNYDTYLAMVDENIAERYKNENKLDRVKATEWQRVSLAILAMGGDPTTVGPHQSIDLIADGTYNRSKTMDIGKQGINGLTWGLLTLDSMRYKVPKDAADSREDIIERILTKQLEDGGFSLKVPPSDADITGMTLQALAPYYNSEKKYNYTREIDNQEREVRVRDVIDEALDYLTYEKLESTESIVQVIVALTALHIDPLSKNYGSDDQNLYEMLKAYQLEDGGFMHSETYDEENPTAKPDESNSMASEQALYAITSMLRYYQGARSLYDFREDMSAELTANIRSIENDIKHITDETDNETLNEIYENYLDIPPEERSYVSNYALLSDALIDAGVQVEIEPYDESMEINSSGKGTVTHLMDDANKRQKKTIFTNADAKRTDKVVKEKSTEYEAEVVTLINILETAENKSDYQTELTLLKDKKKEIDRIKDKIKEIDQLIMKELYPFETITTQDEAVVQEIQDQYNTLTSYDQTNIQNYEDVKKAETQINNLKRAKLIKIIGAILVIALVSYLIYRHKKRKSEKLKQKMLDEN